MFGYVIANLEDISDREKVRYQEAYCGLCRCLRDRFGQRARVALTYDMVFLELLLDSLYEPEERRGDMRCFMHPSKRRGHFESSYAEYAADLTVALAYFNCLDDWRDDRRVGARAYAALLEKPYGQVKRRLPRQCGAIERELAAISEIEQAEGASPDAAAASFGRLMGELFAPRDDEWAGLLRRFGDGLGRFVYLMDAACDLDKDAKSGSYNPLAQLGWDENQAEEALMSVMAQAAAAFEKLPLEQDLHLLRSVVYSGVWQKFNAQYRKGRANMEGAPQAAERPRNGVVRAAAGSSKGVAAARGSEEGEVPRG